ncbi:hypothetical protein CDG81_10480 [Actinopolyspora erythraea]|uniref:Ig-like domain-containing protein n=1 Tax=Actinopolyspora erythraea TaxID=414996 RepID=A0A099D634_9ACTN|nr:hypothetical protein [Actinopolyspora erythraea]ASU78630.1 hypothetical protein CDG81_10480 [Actinopolyspora erythraea]KGI81391.1 hypothetical protein IL38_10505 [Actinopolyspora erythraea]
MKFKTGSRLAALVGATCMAVSIAGVASAQVESSSKSDSLVSLACDGTQEARYSPGLTNEPQEVTVEIDETYDTCTSVPSGITSGSGSSTVTEQASCLVEGTFNVKDVFKYTWNTNEKSEVTFTRTQVVRLANGTTKVTSNGTVTKGLGEGLLAQREVLLLTTSFDACDTEQGLQEQSGPAQLIIGGLA